MNYQARLRCEKCGRSTPHLYRPENRAWRCGVCEAANRLSEELSDVANAAARYMQRTSQEKK